MVGTIKAGTNYRVTVYPPLLKRYTDVRRWSGQSRRGQTTEWQYIRLSWKDTQMSEDGRDNQGGDKLQSDSISASPEKIHRCQKMVGTIKAGTNYRVTVYPPLLKRYNAIKAGTYNRVTVYPPLLKRYKAIKAGTNYGVTVYPLFLKRYNDSKVLRGENQGGDKLRSDSISAFPEKIRQSRWGQTTEWHPIFASHKKRQQSRRGQTTEWQ